MKIGCNAIGFNREAFEIYCTHEVGQIDEIELNAHVGFGKTVFRQRGGKIHRHQRFGQIDVECVLKVLSIMLSIRLRLC